MAIHKLANGPITLTITKIESSEGNFGPQMRFDGANGDCVFISELSATKQLARLNLTLDSAIGQTLHFEQIKKDGKTFTNIHLAGDGAVPTAAAPTASPTVKAVAASAMSFEDVATIYAKCVDTAFMVFGTKCEEVGITPDAASLQAAAATLFIKATR
jgi:hypothetical protein